MLMGSYDIHCQYIINLRQRLKNEFTPKMLGKLKSIQTAELPKIVAGVGNYHLPMHVEKCRPYFSLHNLPGACETCGEQCEGFWGVITGVARCTAEMCPGRRHDYINGLYSFRNCERLHKMGMCLQALSDCMHAVPTLTYACISSRAMREARRWTRQSSRGGRIYVMPGRLHQRYLWGRNHTPMAG